MFAHIIVAEELLAIREAACKGDIEATFTLAKHVLQGKLAAKSGKNAYSIVTSMFYHDDFRKNPRRAWSTYVMMADVFLLQYEEGSISQKEYITNSCEYLQMMIDCMTAAPRHLWNYRQLEDCIAWIREHELKLQEQAL